MFVKLIDSMGTDLTVVNAARVSFGKKKEKFEEGDEKLIKYLAQHNHWSPFAHCSLQFHIKAPVFVARQLVKHQVGLSWNEISRRYVDTDVEFYEVDKWRGKSKDKKQGSEGTLEDKHGVCQWSKTKIENAALESYKGLLSAGVAPEQARMILPQSMMTEWYWSGTLYAFARVCNLRCASDAQYETRIVANLINEECCKLFPISWTELRNT
jgi:thymidylate synthase (FAD)